MKTFQRSGRNRLAGKRQELSGVPERCAGCLVLQLELRSIGSQPPLIMTGLRHRLMMSPKERPGQRVSRGDHLVPQQLPDHAPDLWQGVGDHPLANPLWDLKCCKLLGPVFRSQAFFSCSAFA